MILTRRLALRSAECLQALHTDIDRIAIDEESSYIETSLSKSFLQFGAEGKDRCDITSSRTFEDDSKCHSKNNDLQDTASTRGHDQETQTRSIITCSVGSVTINPKKKDSGCNYNIRGSGYDMIEENAKRNHVENQIMRIVDTITMVNESLLSTSEGNHAELSKTKTFLDIEGNINYDSIVFANTKDRAFHSTSVLNKLKLLERAVQQNNYRSQQRQYRGRRRQGSKTDKNIPPLNHIFDFECPHSSGKTVTCMAWHGNNSDILAVGYSDINKGSSREHLVMLWSPQNVSFPEKIIRTESLCTAIASSNTIPTALAVGLDNGNILIYDTSQQNISSALISTVSVTGSHSFTITDLVWVHDKLISISSEGRVLEWSVKKGMRFLPLFTLARQRPMHIADHGTSDANVVVPMPTMPLCIDFASSGLEYVIGFEEGTLFLCSRSYPEKYLSSDRGHEGSVLSVRFSPMEENKFLSCSTDSTIKLWRCSFRQSELSMILQIKTSNWAPINDVAWSPVSSSTFALVRTDGRMQVWDYSKSVRNPSSEITLSHGELSKVLFANTMCEQVLVVGSDDGVINALNLASSS